MLRFEEALARLLALAVPPTRGAAVEISIADATDRVLAEDVVAAIDLPGFDYSAMDGYAVHTDAMVGPAPFRLRIAGESRTGALPEALTTMTTMRIFTGAAVPPGADAVVMQEDVTRDGDEAVFTTCPRPFQYIRRRGEDLAAGAIAIARGTRLRASHLSLAAALDRASLPVAGAPTVAFLATGDELRHPGSPALPGTIPESITVALSAMARRLHATPRTFPFVRDDRAATEDAFREALSDADVVVTVGGVSVGDHDLVRPALAAVGVELDFWRVAMKPGKPLAVGRFPRAGRRDAIVLGLPGNPVSALLTFALFGGPLLRALQGDSAPAPRPVRGRTTRAYAHDPGRREFVRATMGHDDVGLTVTPLGNQASGAVTALAHADALVVVPEDASGLHAGAEVDVLPLRDLLL